MQIVLALLCIFHSPALVSPKCSLPPILSHSNTDTRQYYPLPPLYPSNIIHFQQCLLPTLSRSNTVPFQYSLPAPSSFNIVPFQHSPPLSFSSTVSFLLYHSSALSPSNNPTLSPFSSILLLHSHPPFYYLSPTLTRQQHLASILSPPPPMLSSNTISLSLTSLLSALYLAHCSASVYSGASFQCQVWIHQYRVACHQHTSPAQPHCWRRRPRFVLIDTS